MGRQERADSMKGVVSGVGANIAILALGAFVVSDLVTADSLIDRFGIVAIVLLVVVGVSGHTARRSARRELESTRAAREELAEFGRRRKAFLELSDLALHGTSLDELFDRATAVLVRHVGGSSHSAVFEIGPESRPDMRWGCTATGTASCCV